MEESGQLHAPAALPPRKIGCWVGPRAGLYPVSKRKISRLCRESISGRPTHSLVILLAKPPIWLKID
jgi:hypothetical protein